MAAARWRLICLALVLAGLVASGYLLARTFALLSQFVPGGIDICQQVAGSTCDDTLQDSSSWILGVPLAGWGVVYFGTIACLLIMAWLMRSLFDRQATLAAFLLSAVGAAASVALTISLAFGDSPMCPMCLAIHAVNLALVPVLKMATGRTLRGKVGGKK